MNSNLLPLLGINTPKKFSSIIHLSPVHINLSELIRKGKYFKLFSALLEYNFPFGKILFEFDAEVKRNLMKIYFPLHPALQSYP